MANSTSDVTYRITTRDDSSRTIIRPADADKDSEWLTGSFTWEPTQSENELLRNRITELESLVEQCLLEVEMLRAEMFTDSG